VGGMVYTVGNEQDYHFKVLFLILSSFVTSLIILVDLPSGKMKSREEQFVADAD
jgi:arginyl-tRNA synthetase